MSAPAPIGPWKRVGHRQIADAHGNVIAEVWSGGCATLEAADAAEELIAAAPSLLAALSALVDSSAEGGLFPDDYAEELSAARAAIARATGAAS